MKRYCNRQVVIGLGFGDEGKGAVVQSLCRRMLEESKEFKVTRYCGGPNAGHTVQNNGITHVCSSFGSGVLLNVPTQIASSALLNPMCLKEEYDVLCNAGISPRFSIAPYTNLISPYDVLANLEDEESLKNGTCGKGMWKARERTISSRYFGYFNELSDRNSISNFLRSITNYYGVAKKYRLESIFGLALEWAHLYQSSLNAEFEIYESSQGVLLDQKFGFSPYTTPSDIFPSYIKGGYDYFFVTRTYTTRHGAGYIPTIVEGFYDLSDKFESNVNNDLQGEFKVGVLDLDILNRGIDRAHIYDIPKKHRNLVITHMDVPIKENKFFYKLNGVVHLIEDVDESKIANEIAKHLYVDFNEIYYLDAPDGDIKLVY